MADVQACIDTTTQALKAAGVNVGPIHQHDAVMTAEEQLKVAAEQKWSGTVAKNLFVKDKKKRLFLLTIDANRKVDLKKVAKQLVGCCL